MYFNKNLFQPTLFGELYYNKPPAFNWFIIVSSSFVGWNELTARLVSLAFLFLSTFTIFLFSLYLFKSIRQSLISSLLFLTSGNVLFFYGYLGEIEATLTFFIFSAVVCLYLWWDKDYKFLGFLSGVLFGVAVLLKGLPAYGFLALSMLAMVLYYRRLRPTFSKLAFLIYSLCLLIPLLWLLNTQEPLIYIKTLWEESFRRVEGKGFSRLWHMLTYPVENFKDLLPGSVLFLLSLYLGRKGLHVPAELRPFLLLLALNYIPYWLSNSAGRYVLPLYPILAIIAGYYVNRVMEHDSFRKLFYSALTITIILRIAYAFVYFPYIQQKDREQSVAQSILSDMAGKGVIACECPHRKDICLYLGIWNGKPLKRLALERGADYVINCQEGPVGRVIGEYELRRGDRARLESLK
ncbi:MAG: glycosyl transferase [Acidobacteria bacterium]|jgi:4-amino-4-deoxy-L-arabinose transferase-like glycosyltransferase|nr:MAG: glycosyl transferase [Acidobacteriota bacterium]